MVDDIILVAKNTHGYKSCVIYKTLSFVYTGMVGDIIAGAHLGPKSVLYTQHLYRQWLVI